MYYRDSCAVTDNINEILYLTGHFSGQSHHSPYSKQVTMYGPNGFLEDLPHLNVGRHNHACAGYLIDSGQFVLLVAGGLDENIGNFYHKTIEINCLTPRHSILH